MFFQMPKTPCFQVDINGDRIGLTKPVDVGIQGDAGLVAETWMSTHQPVVRQKRGSIAIFLPPRTEEDLLAQLTSGAGQSGRAEREKLIQELTEVINIKVITRVERLLNDKLSLIFYALGALSKFGERKLGKEHMEKKAPA